MALLGSDPIPLVKGGCGKLRQRANEASWMYCLGFISGALGVGLCMPLQFFYVGN